MTHIEAMKLALEALERVKAERFHPAKVFAHNPSIIALRQAIAEAEQAQPIGHIRVGHKADFVTTKAADDLLINDWHPVYTAPPQRQPLTEHELLYTYNKLPNWGSDMDNLPNGLRLFARAIEAAHGIKENL